MVTADWVVLGVGLLFALIGLLIGFGKSLKFFTSGLVGFLISLIVCYFCYGMVTSWGFVQEFMVKVATGAASLNNWFGDVLVRIHCEVITLCVCMFLVVQVLRIIVVTIIKNIAEANHPVVRAINKFVGMLFMLCIAAMLGLIVFQVASWIGGNTATTFGGYLEGSALKLDWIYEHNPLISMYESIVK